MSDILLSFLLGLVQGLTEFLPISSSAHLLLPSLIFGSSDLGLSFDIAVHAGTLVAVMYFFRSELLLMTTSIITKRENLHEYRKLAFQLIIATIPIVITGLIFSDLIEQRIFSTLSIAIANLIFAMLLLIVFLYKKSNISIFELTLYGALIIGIIQCFALIPGASRSGIVITAALLIGMNLKDASKFSFMLGIPTILGALVLLVIEMQTLNLTYNFFNLIIGFITSMVFAFFTIKLFLGFVERIGMIPFVIYRVILGLILLLLI
tara:strand:+ start:14725 stop:15516 length:792 start_codon:yes stop_codon:yes gene_type:complete